MEIYDRNKPQTVYGALLACQKIYMDKFEFGGG